MLMIMCLALQEAAKSPLKGLLGAFHPGIVHFPIALLSVAALLEVLQLVRKRKEPTSGTAALVYLAALAAVPAAFFGFMLADYNGEEGRLLDLHKWLGVGSTVVAVAAAGCAWKARTCAGSLLGLRISLILGSLLVLATGYLGGELVFGEGHVMKHLNAILGLSGDKSPSPPSHPEPPPAASGPNGGNSTTNITSKVDFMKDVMPILRDDCFKCHGGEKVKGKFKLTNRTTAIETEAESGRAILPHKPASSKFITLLTDPDPDVIMPPPKEKHRPSKAQIELLRLWVEQGADWPKDFEFKK